MCSNHGNKQGKQPEAGRKWARDPAVHRYGIKLSGEENAHFTSLFLQPGMNEKAKFIKNMIFGTEMKMVRIDKAAEESYQTSLQRHQVHAARIESMIEEGKALLLVDVSHGNRNSATGLFLKPELQGRREKIPPGNSCGTGE